VSVCLTRYIYRERETNINIYIIYTTYIKCLGRTSEPRTRSASPASACAAAAQSHWIARTAPAGAASSPSAAVGRPHTSGDTERGSGLSRYKIVFHFKAVLWESFILLLPSPLPATPILLQYYCTTFAQYTPRNRPPLCMPYTIHLMTISCKGQVGSGLSVVMVDTGRDWGGSGQHQDRKSCTDALETNRPVLFLHTPFTSSHRPSRLRH